MSLQNFIVDVRDNKKQIQVHRPVYLYLKKYRADGSFVSERRVIVTEGKFHLSGDNADDGIKESQPMLFLDGHIDGIEQDERIAFQRRTISVDVFKTYFVVLS